VRVFGLVGGRRAGKRAVARILVEQHGFAQMEYGETATGQPDVRSDVGRLLADPGVRGVVMVVGVPDREVASVLHMLDGVVATVGPPTYAGMSQFRLANEGTLADLQQSVAAMLLVDRWCFPGYAD
jgi:hypothetical protein